MCGLAGIIDAQRRGDETSLTRIATAMADSIRHRGPDDGGSWCDAQSGFAVGFRRLSIIDLSPLGHQPMVSACGRWVIAYNGEVYNYRELRRELEIAGYVFRSHSDTEVILECCARWGVEPTIRRLIGMFAIALWDRSARKLFLIRDRLGIKPLYWGQFANLFLFGSELKALKCHPDWRPQIDTAALSAFLRCSYMPAPLSIYRGVHKLEPGRILTIAPGIAPVIKPYWTLADVVENGIEHRLDITDSDAVGRLDELLRDAVGRRMVADVPLGAFLSGGIDSSTVVALMQAQSDRPVKTFSIGFHEMGYNEAGHAKAIADHLGTEHTELYVKPGQALDVIERLPTIFDEPFADPSQIPTFLISQLTRNHVTVSLSGDGGDELFAGYNRYRLARSLSMLAETTPKLLRRIFGSAIGSIPPAAWDHLFGMLPNRIRPPQPGDKLHKLAAILPVRSEEIYQRLVSHWHESPVLSHPGEAPIAPMQRVAAHEKCDKVEVMQYLDTITYLPDDILTKVDRASMAVALEARVPLLDHRVVEFAWRLPMRFKIRAGETKWLLRQVLEKYVPRRLTARPKMGFGVPIDSWLRGPLRDWAESLLARDRLEAAGYLDASPIRQRWEEHLAGHRNWQYSLWGILMFQAWLQAEQNPTRIKPRAAIQVTV
jgi:asparagine synthase (glutamine-hydrolysing)